MMMKFLEPIQKTFADLKRDPVEQVKKSPVFWVLSILFLAWLIIEVPRWQASRVTLTDPDKYFQVENEARKTILQGLGGGFFFISAYFTWRSLQVSEKTRQAAEDKQVTERFVKAAEMLADEKDRLEVKTAGIYGLERIAHDSEDDHWTVMEVLTLLIRNKTASRHVDPEQKELLTFPEDLQVALTVIGRRDVKKDRDRRLDLAQANLSRADLSEGNFSRADLSEVNLSRANLIKANLSEANLSEANLSGAVLSEANFNGADLRGVNFSEADLSETNFSGADLRGTDLRWQDLSEAYLRGTNFNGADLSEANLSLHYS